MMSASGSRVKRERRQDKRGRGGRKQEGERGSIPGEDNRGEKSGKVTYEKLCSNNIAKL
jgi:hypothetical protein